MKQSILIIAAAIVFISCQDSAKKSSIKIGNATISEEMGNDQTPLQASIERGGMVYTDFCMQCHLANGKGIPGNFPPLANSNWLKDKRAESIHAVKFGQKGEIEVNGKVYNGVMAPMGLSDQEVADVMNYVMNNWGNKQEKMVTEAEVAEIKE